MPPMDAEAITHALHRSGLDGRVEVANYVSHSDQKNITVKTCFLQKNAWGGTVEGNITLPYHRCFLFIPGKNVGPGWRLAGMTGEETTAATIAAAQPPGPGPETVPLSRDGIVLGCPSPPTCQTAPCADPPGWA